MAGAMQDIVARGTWPRMKDMLAELNQLLEQREPGEETDATFDEFMERFGDFFPENPQNLDELLEPMAQRMAAHAGDDELDDARAAGAAAGPHRASCWRTWTCSWQMDQLWRQPPAGLPAGRLGQALRLLRPGPAGLRPRRASLMNELGDIDQLENLLRRAHATPAPSPRSTSTGPASCSATSGAERLGTAGRAGQDARGGRASSRTRRAASSSRRGACARSARTPSPTCSRSWPRTRWAGTRSSRTGVGHERSYETKPYEFGDPFNLHIERTVRNAVARAGGGTPVRALAGGLRDRAHRDDDPVVHGPDARPVALDADARQLPRRQEGGDGAALADLHRSSRATTSASSGFSEVARELKPEQLPEVSWDFVYGTNMQHGFLLSRRLLGRQTGTKQIIMITDGEPTAHITRNGEVFFNYPPVRETVDATLTEVTRCTRDGIRINTFMLDADQLPAGLHREAHQDEPGPRLLHHARDPRRLRPRRLHRAQAHPAQQRRPRRPPSRLTEARPVFGGPFWSPEGSMKGR